MVHSGTLGPEQDLSRLPPFINQEETVRDTSSDRMSYVATVVRGVRHSTVSGSYASEQLPFQ